MLVRVTPCWDVGAAVRDKWALFNKPLGWLLAVEYLCPPLVGRAGNVAVTLFI